MRNLFVGFFVVTMALAGCAHRGAVRVECQGPLRPINPSAEIKGKRASVAPASPSTRSGAGKSL
jgi:hypothetical protein